MLFDGQTQGFDDQLGGKASGASEPGTYDERKADNLDSSLCVSSHKISSRPVSLGSPSPSPTTIVSLSSPSSTAAPSSQSESSPSSPMPYFTLDQELDIPLNVLPHRPPTPLLSCSTSVLPPSIVGIKPSISPPRPDQGNRGHFGAERTKVGSKYVPKTATRTSKASNTRNAKDTNTQKSTRATKVPDREQKTTLSSGTLSPTFKRPVHRAKRRTTGATSAAPSKPVQPVKLKKSTRLRKPTRASKQAISSKLVNGKSLMKTPGKGTLRQSMDQPSKKRLRPSKDEFTPREWSSKASPTIQSLRSPQPLSLSLPTHQVCQPNESLELKKVDDPSKIVDAPRSPQPESQKTYVSFLGLVPTDVDCPCYHASYAAASSVALHPSASESGTVIRTLGLRDDGLIDRQQLLLTLKFEIFRCQRLFDRIVSEPSQELLRARFSMIHHGLMPPSTLPHRPDPDSGADLSDDTRTHTSSLTSKEMVVSQEVRAALAPLIRLRYHQSLERVFFLHWRHVSRICSARFHILSCADQHDSLRLLDGCMRIWKRQAGELSSLTGYLNQLSESFRRRRGLRRAGLLVARWRAFVSRKNRHRKSVQNVQSLSCAYLKRWALSVWCEHVRSKALSAVLMAMACKADDLRVKLKIFGRWKTACGKQQYLKAVLVHRIQGVRGVCRERVERAGEKQDDRLSMSRLARVFIQRTTSSRSTSSSTSGLAQPFSGGNPSAKKGRQYDRARRDSRARANLRLKEQLVPLIGYVQVLEGRRKEDQGEKRRRRAVSMEYCFEVLGSFSEFINHGETMCSQVSNRTPILSSVSVTPSTVKVTPPGGSSRSTVEMNRHEGASSDSPTVFDLAGAWFAASGTPRPLLF